MKAVTLKNALIGLSLLAVTACSPVISRHGYVPSEEELLELVPGVDSRDSALELLPPPTAGGVGENGSLYFVQSQFRTIGPFEPQEITRQVVAVNVGADGVITGIERYGLEDGIVVPLSRRVTSDNVADVSFIRQLMGNLGRFDASTMLGAGGGPGQ